MPRWRLDWTSTQILLLSVFHQLNFLLVLNNCQWEKESSSLSRSLGRSWRRRRQQIRKQDNYTKENYIKKNLLCRASWVVLPRKNILVFSHFDFAACFSSLTPIYTRFHTKLFFFSFFHPFHCLYLRALRSSCGSDTFEVLCVYFRALLSSERVALLSTKNSPIQPS